MGFEGAKLGFGWERGGGAFSSPLSFRHFGSCQGPDGSEGGRARGLALRSEVLFSGGRGELGLDHALRPGGSLRAGRDGAAFPTQVRSGEVSLGKLQV